MVVVPARRRPHDVVWRDGDGQIAHVRRDIMNALPVRIGALAGRDHLGWGGRGDGQVEVRDLAEEGVARIDVLPAVPVAVVYRHDREPVSERHATRRDGQAAGGVGWRNRETQADLGGGARRQRARQRKLQDAAVEVAGYVLTIDGRRSQAERPYDVRDDSKDDPLERHADHVAISHDLAGVDTPGVEINGRIEP